MADEINIIGDDVFYEYAKVATLSPDLMGTIRDRFIGFLEAERFDEDLHIYEDDAKLTEGLKEQLSDKFAEVSENGEALTLDKINEILDKWEGDK
tara:strand:+ start:19381 stop:19665 length:285 start_codon:yes stop_codon:yes gene_type:complete